MKKVLLVLLLVFVCFSAFAVNHELSLLFSPYSWHRVTHHQETDAKITSKYGTGFKIDYTLNPFEDFVVTGCELGINTYSKENDPNWFLSATLLAKFGYTFQIGKNSAVIPEIVYGAELQRSDNTSSWTQNIGAGLTASYRITNQWAVSGKFECLFAFPDRNVEYFADRKINLFLGASFLLK